MEKKNLRLVAGAVVGVALVATTITAGASSASAESAGRKAGYGTFSFNSRANVNAGGAQTGPDGLGSETGFSANQEDLSNWLFESNGNGKGVTVWHNAHHFWNDDTSRTAYVMYNTYAAAGNCWCGQAEYYLAEAQSDLPGIFANHDSALYWS